MPRASSLAILRFISLAEPESGYRSPEADAEVFPFAPATPAHLAMWECATFSRLRRTRLFLGLRSASQQHREGVWGYRPEWVFPTLNLAKLHMELEYGDGHGYLVRVLELSAIVFEEDCAWLVVSHIGEGQGAPSATSLYKRLVADLGLIRASAPLSVADRGQISDFLDQPNLVAWAAPADCDWHRAGPTELPLLLHTLGRKGVWSARSIPHEKGEMPVSP